MPRMREEVVLFQTPLEQSPRQRMPFAASGNIDSLIDSREKEFMRKEGRT